MVEYALMCEQLRQDNLTTFSMVSHYHRFVKYANFLQQPLTLGMFVPCGEDGKVLECPPNWSESWRHQKMTEVSKRNVQYLQAKYRVVFEGFKVIEISHGLRIVKNRDIDCQVMANQHGNHYYTCNEFTNIETLCNYDLTLTQSKYDELFK